MVWEDATRALFSGHDHLAIPRAARRPGFGSGLDGAHITFLGRGMALLDGATIHLKDRLDDQLLAVTSHRRTAVKHKARWRGKDLFQAVRQGACCLLADLNPGDALHDLQDIADIR